MANPVTQIILTAVDRTKAAFSSVTGELRSLGDAATSLRSIVGGLFVGLSVAKFVGSIKRAADEMDNANKAAQAVGTSVENFSALTFAASQSGVEVEVLQASLAKLARSLDDAKSGSLIAAEAFQRLQIDPKTFSDPADALLVIAERFQSMPDGVNKSALAMNIFGRSGAQLIPLLNQGRDGIEALKEEAARLGVVFSSEAAAAAEEFNDNLDKLNSAAKGLGNSVAAEILPGLTQITQAMAEAAKEGNILKSLWVGLGGLGAAIFTDDLLTNTQKLEKAQRQLNDALEGGFERESDWVRELETSIVVLKNAVAEEKRVEEERRRNSQATADALGANRKQELAEFKKSTDEQIKDANRLQAALQSAFSASIKAEQDYRRQAKKLRDEANGTAATPGDAESQALANLSAIAALMKLQRTAGTDSLENVQDQAQALRDLAGQIDDAAKKTEYLKAANLAEATALDAAAAEEKARYEELNRQQAESVRQANNLQAALDGFGKEVSVDIKVLPGVEKTKQDLTEVLHLINAIKDAGPVNVNATVPGAAASASSLRTEALKYGNR